MHAMHAAMEQTQRVGRPVPGRRHLLARSGPHAIMRAFYMTPLPQP